MLYNVTINTLKLNEKLNDIKEEANATQESHIEREHFFPNLFTVSIRDLKIITTIIIIIIIITIITELFAISYSCNKEKRA